MNPPKPVPRPAFQSPPPLSARAKGSLVVLLCTILGLAAGCRLGPDYAKPSVPMPAGWRGANPSPESLANTAWWDFFSDPVLTNHVAIAIENNKDLRVAVARVEQALENYRAQRSFLLPSVNAAANWTRARVGNVPPAPGATGGQFDVFGLLSYEVDVWGRVRRLAEAGRAQYLATDQARRAVYISLVANVAATYFDLLALDSQLQIARQTYESRTNSLQLTQIKFHNGEGIVSELDVQQAETQVHAASSTIAQVERLIVVRENALSFLLGRNPGPVERGHLLRDQVFPAELPPGLPSDLLQRRPDILAAEQRMAAASANIGAARAAYFPTISLTAALGLQSVELDDLFDPGLSKAWNFAPQIAAPIFNSGRIRAGVRFARAEQIAALAEYEETIQNAFREVEDGLVSIMKLKEQVNAETAGVAAERRRLALSRMRYENGVSSYSDVLDAERFLFNAELGLVQTRAQLLTAYAQFYKTLGGGWYWQETE
jgi:outer membrane protein, multidrug efflux system